jgi:hypothetical protein
MPGVTRNYYYPSLLEKADLVGLNEELTPTAAMCNTHLEMKSHGKLNKLDDSLGNIIASLI